MAKTYAQYVTTMAELIGGISVTNSAIAAPFDSDNWNNVLGDMIDYAEGRMYRDPSFDFLATYGTATAACTLNSRNITKPATMIIVTAVNLITPAGNTPDQQGSKRTPLDRKTVPYIDAAWPLVYDGTSANVGPPVDYAPLSDTAFRLGPVPDAAYVLEFDGVTRPAALSSANTATFITTNLGDVFVAASMVFACGMMKNFSAQSDNPQMALGWENTYQQLKIGAATEEARKKSQGAAWSSKPPPPIATPPRS